MDRKILVVFILLSFVLNAQNDLLEQRANLTEEIRRIRKEIESEQKFFEDYQREKESIIAYKHQENESLDEDIRETSSQIRKQRRELIKVESEILNLENHDRRITAKVRSFASEFLVAIDQGIPFEREKRKGILSALIYDIDNSSISANESFARLLSFLNLELTMAYDSQVIRTTIEMDGVRRDVNLLRIGRVFFAVDDGQGVYLWKKNNGEYTLSEATLSPFETRAIRNTVEMIQGKRIPDLMLLPFHGSEIQKDRTLRFNNGGQ